MPNWLAIVLRPLALVVLLVAAVTLSRWLSRFIPDGRVKRFLYARHEVVPRDFSTVSLRTQRICTAVIVVIALLIIFKPFRYLVP
jgi:small-conductance mechanosensitive channel